MFLVYLYGAIITDYSFHGYGTRYFSTINYFYRSKWWSWGWQWERRDWSRRNGWWRRRGYHTTPTLITPIHNMSTEWPAVSSSTTLRTASNNTIHHVPYTPSPSTSSYSWYPMVETTYYYQYAPGTFNDTQLAQLPTPFTHKHWQTIKSRHVWALGRRDEVEMSDLSEDIHFPRESPRPRPHTHGREAVPVPVLQARLHASVDAAESREAPHGRETVQVWPLRQGVHAVGWSKVSSQDARHTLTGTLFTHKILYWLFFHTSLSLSSLIQVAPYFIFCAFLFISLYIHFKNTCCDTNTWHTIGPAHYLLLNMCPFKAESDIAIAS